MNKILTRALLCLLAFGLTNIGSAQDADEKKSKNLVTNGSFEQYEGSLRRKEQLELAKNWINPTDAKSELYSTEVKSRYIAVPDNMYGSEEPSDSLNYAGLVAYGYRGKIPRSYLQAELSESLKEKGLYCVKFRASLAERSRYAANNLGVSLDKSKLSAKGMTSLDAENPLFTQYNEVVDAMIGWWEFCALYRASGKEKYITIGNFSSDDRTNTVLQELNEKYAEEGPIMGAYYYIDDVKVEPIEPGESCNCAHERIPESKVIFSGSTQLNDEMTVQEKLEAIDAYFYQYQAELVSATERTIDKVVDIMVQNPSASVMIIGHCDNEEVALAETESGLRGLAQKRAILVRNYMINSGIDESRLSIKSMDNSAPVSNMSTSISLAKNRRVEFELK